MGRMRILITVTPQMYRQAIAFSIRSRRPGCDVKIASPGATAGEIADFEPHLLLHNDNDGLGSEVMAGIMCRVTVRYTDGMDARITTRDEVREARDMSTDELLRVVDAASTMAGE
jgi:hypothetical protein